MIVEILFDFVKTGSTSSYAVSQEVAERMQGMYSVDEIVYTAVREGVYQEEPAKHSVVLRVDDTLASLHEFLDDLAMKLAEQSCCPFAPCRR